MSDDSFIREVDEELRSARVQEFWSKYGKIMIAIAVLIVLVTAGYRYWEYHQKSEAARAGDAFMAAVRLAEDGKNDEALAALKALESDGEETYRTLALMRSASELATKGQVEEAVKNYDAIAADNKAEENLRSIARVRAGMLMVDAGSVTEVEARVGPLTAPGGPYRLSAHEALGLAYYKAGDLENAFKQFEVISKDSGTPSALGQRTRIMLDLIASNGGPALES